MTSKQEPAKGWRICEGCGQPFRYWRDTARFCKASCRVKASRVAKGTKSA